MKKRLNKFGFMRFIYLMLMIYIQVNYEHSVQTVPRGMNTP